MTCRSAKSTEKCGSSVCALGIQPTRSVPPRCGAAAASTPRSAPPLTSAYPAAAAAVVRRNSRRLMRSPSSNCASSPSLRTASREPNRHGLRPLEQHLLAGLDERVEVPGDLPDARHVELALRVAPLTFAINERDLVELMPRVVIVNDVAALEPRGPVLDLADIERIVLFGAPGGPGPADVDRPVADRQVREQRRHRLRRPVVPELALRAHAVEVHRDLPHPPTAPFPSDAWIWARSRRGATPLR